MWDFAFQYIYQSTDETDGKSVWLTLKQTYLEERKPILALALATESLDHLLIVHQRYFLFLWVFWYEIKWKLNWKIAEGIKQLNGLVQHRYKEESKKQSKPKLMHNICIASWVTAMCGPCSIAKGFKIKMGVWLDRSFKDNSIWLGVHIKISNKIDFIAPKIKEIIKNKILPPF